MIRLLETVIKTAAVAITLAGIVGLAADLTTAAYGAARTAHAVVLAAL